MNINYIKKWLKENLTADRYAHTLGTAQTALELAEIFKVDKDKAYIAALLHDCSKCKTEKEMKEIMQGKIREMDPDEVKNLKILHAPVGAYLAREGFGVKDADILSAIRWHTLGKVDMNLLEMIIFLADKIEPNNRNAEFHVRAMDFLRKNPTEKSLKIVILECYVITIKSLVDRRLPIMKMTIDTYNELLRVVKISKAENEPLF